MKNHLLILFTILSYSMQAQDTNSIQRGFGFSIHSNYNSELKAIEMAPTALYHLGKSQFEFGVGLNPFSLKNQRIVSGQFNYKYFPNGRSNKFNMYFMLSCNYTNQLKKTYYPTTNQYLFASGGYGFEVTLMGRLTLSTNLNLGTFTQRMRTENPYLEQLGKINLLDNLDMSLSAQVSLAYRF